ncbi:MAG: hypothetical protein PF440_05385 [Thiomicrorhabdus sp.]|nr:hypothetical protein [Thiomicrorhabdus sp.]
MKPTQEMFDEPVEEEQKQAPKKKPAQKRKPKPEPVEESDIELTGNLANTFDLPSNGAFGYPTSVEYRDILAKDEEILANATADTYARTLNGVIKSVMMDCPFYENLSIHDRDYALIWLWANNYESKKSIEIECEHCEHKATDVVDLTNLETIEPKEGFTGAFEMTLKVTGKPIKVRLRTVGDENAVENFMLKNKKHRFEYLMMIRAIDLGMDVALEQKIKWVGDNITGREMAIIKAFHEHYSYGIKTQLEHKCPACSGVTLYELPFQTEDILNPTVSVDFGEYV